MSKRFKAKEEEDENIQHLELLLSKELEEHEYDTIIAVSAALSGVRMDLDMQDIAQLVLDLYVAEQGWPSIGFAVLSATIESSLQ